MQYYDNYIYMDNFRGFLKTTIPFCNMNFLVGENSTGKSSVLSLIKIMTSFNFWFDFEFRTEELNLGHASDIISASSKEKGQFRVGYYRNKDSSGEAQNSLINNSFVLTFKNVNGIPEARKLSILISNKIALHIKTSGKKAYYKIDLSSLNGEESPEEMFEKISQFHDIGKGYKAAKADKDIISGGIKLREALYLVMEALSKEIKFEGEIKYGYLMPRGSIRPTWLAPIRSRPKRTYDDPTNDFSPEGDHTPYVLSSIIGNSKNKKLQQFIEDTGKNSGLFKKIDLKRYGRSKNSPFELDIVLEENPLNIVNVGYGVSQALPILTEIATASKKTWFIIQQPEVHLHPKAQAEIGTLLFYAATNWEQKFLIETHSDYMIDRYRISLQKNNKDNKKVQKSDTSSQILFFQRKDGVNVVNVISINSNGEIDQNQPDEYRDFFLKEQMELLGL